MEQEKKIPGSDIRYSDMYQNLLNGFAYCEVIFKENKSVDYTYISVSSSYEKLTGLKNITGKKASEVMPGLLESDPLYFDVITRVALSGMPETFETFATPIGKWFSISMYSPQKGFFIGLIDDITEKKKAGEQQALFASIVNSSGDAIISTDLSGTITSLNPGAEKLFGYKAQEAIGINIKKFIPKELLYEEKNIIEKIARGEPVAHYETQRLRKDGTLIYISLTVSPIKDPAGNITGVSKVARDIAESKKSILEKEIFINELSQNNKDLQQFAYITSHNLRAPIAHLLGLSNLLDNYSIEDKTLAQILKGIKSATYRFDETIQDLSTILTIRDNPSVFKEPLLLSLALEKAKNHCETLINENMANIEVDFSEAPEVNFSRPYLESIFLNLLTNALKYRHYERPLAIKIKAKSETDFVKLTFSDNGIGFDVEAHKHRIFKLYQRFHADREGKGLGLFLIKSQLETLGGTIAIESKENVGTQFTLQFKK